MHIHKSVKNIFLGITFLCIFLLPGVAEAKYDFGTTHADKLKKSGWTNEEIKKLNDNINNVSSGSYYKSSYNGIDLTVNLYNDNPTKYSLKPIELEGLKSKLKEGGSTFNTDNLKEENIYQINDGITTNYIYDPTPKDKTDGGEVALLTATNGDKNNSLALVYKKPVLKEISGESDSENLKSKNTNSLNAYLNANDIANGREVGTTVAKKNKITNFEEKQSDLLQQKSSADAEVEELQNQINNPATNPQDIPRLTEALEQARLKANNASSSLNDINTQLSGAYNTQAQASMDAQRDYNATACDSTWKAITNFYCLTFTIAKFTNIIFKLMSFVTYIVGTLFDYSLELSINSAEFFKKLGVIEITWSFLRDILNITFIFILLWTSIQILLGNDAKYNAKKVLMNVVLVAILINFSLFAAKIMVDGSNIVSLKIYETMKAGTAEKTASISERVMNTVGLTALYDINQIFADTTTFAQKGSACQNNPGALITISVMGSIFLVILCLALGLAAILFLIRLVNIIILFIKSPLWVWGFVLPGSKTVSKFKDEWWVEMKHVLVFPIAYMFWMLVAIIIFDKLGKVSQGVGVNGSKVTLLDLICSSPGTGGLSQSISLVAIFAIVIIFMMQAIKYGVNNAAASGNSVGGSFANAAAKKFGGWQDAMTKGMAKKTWDKTSGVAVAAGSLAAGAGIGAAKGSLVLAGRTGMGVAKGFGGVGDKGFRKGFSEGFLNPGINAKEWLRDAARSQVANGGIIGELTGVTSKAAKLADKYKDPVNIAGETKKQAEERRTKKSVEDEKLRYAAIDSYYKIDSQKDWLEKNSTKTVDDYIKHVDKVLEQRTDAILGKGVSQKAGKPDKDGKKKTHLEEIRAAAIKETVNEKGERQIKINEYAMHGALEDIIKYRSEGEGLKTGDLTNSKKRIEVMRNRKAQARIKAGLGAAIKGSKSAAFGKKNELEKTEDFNKKIKALQEKIKELPEVKIIKELSEQKKQYVGKGENENGIKEYNKAVDKYSRARTPDDLAKYQREMDAAIEKYTAYVENKKSALIKEEERLGNHLKAIDEKENKDKK